MAADATVATVDTCGAMHVKTSIWGTWATHAGCEAVSDVAISPDGQTFAAVKPDGRLAIKQGLWGDWHVHAHEVKAVALGPDGMVAIANTCGAMLVKTSIWGTWATHAGCEAVSDVAISPDGQTFAAVKPDGRLAIKQGLWGDWHVHAHEVKAVALGPDGMVAIANTCGAMLVKTSIWGTWATHAGCEAVSDVAISPDGQTFAAVKPDGRLAIKQGLWGNWAVHTDKTKTVALARAL